MRLFKLFCISFALLFCSSLQAESSLPTPMQSFINQMVQNQHFDRKTLTTLFKQVELQPSIIKSITTPYEAQPWYKYRSHFLNQARIEGGVNYWKKNRKFLEAAQQRYGVDPAIIVGIIGVETNYGNLIGHYRVIDALSTLAFNYPPRSKFFTEELKEYLLMCRQQGINPLSLKGSYAGAFGIPQFMPSSSRRFAVAYNPNSIIDISNKHEDAIMSVANYFKTNHWQLGSPVATPVSIQGSAYKNVLESKVQLNYSLAQLKQDGVRTSSTLQAQPRASLIELQDENAPEYWVVFPNFKTIMSYNPRIAYAMAVYQLSEAVKQRMDESS
ncbi:MAG TPA: lytic murein transglycosylase B [Coxiellaceae bacterium]|nr:lytic murein transglycosylase B [Coxiellaceae bacterium]